MSIEEKAEWIPAHLEYEGPAKVSEYFDSRVQEGENGKYVGFFRGHEMVGKYLDIPEGYGAYVVSAKDKKLEKMSDITKIRVWDLDAPSLDASLQFTDIVTVGQILAED
ncbi:hypothetical protein TRFO_35531 [Tritrichomonas foetus]|uniref:Uncharacterized protein n=1 Tax=Tritrichomonas foetus TaxID=1144522 RepID=A0A1J4JFW3_9EUKA|nr:hypothetical protein TRFO_35531 [Tritrichomonas foetus]|eukprot:OHS98110.1 hypothetical protein TRFO_35531 [Tritrichomonas foetus]